MYAAELNPVLACSLYPRALPLGGEPTAADRQVLANRVHAEQRWPGSEPLAAHVGLVVSDEPGQRFVQRVQRAVPGRVAEYLDGPGRCSR